MHNTTHSPEPSHGLRGERSADRPLAAAVWGPPPVTEEVGGSHRGWVRSGVSTRIWLSRPAALERGAVVVEVGVSRLPRNDHGDLGKYLIEELLARLALCTSFAARRIDRDGLAK